MSSMALSWSGNVREAVFGSPPEEETKPTRSPTVQETSDEVADASTSPEFVELYSKHVDYVWKTARRLGIPDAEADDVVQETFLRVLRLRKLYVKDRGSERTWLFALLFRVVQHHRRWHSRRSAHMEDGVDFDVLPADGAMYPDRYTENVESIRVAEEILEGLDPERRAVLVLAELEEKPVSEIAALLGINVNTATSRLRQARKHVEAAIARRAARDQWRYR